MHICQDEILMFMSMIPWVGIFFHKVHLWYHTKFKHKCHTKGCDEQHVEHSNDESN